MEGGTDTTIIIEQNGCNRIQNGMLSARRVVNISEHVWIWESLGVDVTFPPFSNPDQPYNAMLRIYIYIYISTVYLHALLNRIKMLHYFRFCHVGNLAHVIHLFIHLYL